MSLASGILKGLKVTRVDLIERKAALYALCEDCKSKYDGLCPHEASKCIEYRAINRLPAIEAEPVRHGRWIPCSERMPGRFDSVLLAILSKNGYGEPAYYVTIGGLKNGNEFESYTGDICECEKVTHWMPLPEPLEGGADNG